MFVMSLLTPDATVTDNSRRTTVFDSTTSLTVDPSHTGRFGVDLDPAWSSLVGIHGGYLSAIVINAAHRVAGDRPIRTLTTSFLRPGSIGPASVDVDVVRHGRSITNLAVTLSQSSKSVLVSHIVAADVVESTSWE